LHRRDFLKLAGLSAISGLSTIELAPASLLAANNQSPSPKALAQEKPDFSLRIAPLKVELAPGRIVDTVGYNGTVPGPLLRAKEGQRITIDVRNDNDVPKLVHWHGLKVPSDMDGAMDEGTPMASNQPNFRPLLDCHFPNYLA
jgi:FtsP/CotA-like multicopper oxidase with cupredoxin domain